MQEESQQHLVKNSTSTKTKTKTKTKIQSKANQTASHDRQRNEHDNIVRREQRLLTIITIQTQRTKTKTVTKSPLSALVSPQLPKAMTKLRQKRKRAKGGGREATRKQAQGGESPQSDETTLADFLQREKKRRTFRPFILATRKMRKQRYEL